MKPLLACLAVAALIGFVVGCELTDEEETDVKFVNLSSHTVHVYLNGAPSPSFVLAPGESHTVHTSHQVFFTFEPDWAVEVGKNEAGRVYFVNIGSEGVE